MEQKRAKEDSDALFLIQRSHFLVTSAVTMKCKEIEGRHQNLPLPKMKPVGPTVLIAQPCTNGLTDS